MQAVRAPLSKRRQHFQHGPIDLVIGADGDPTSVAEAHETAWRRFRTVLPELVAELPALRRPVAGEVCPLGGPIARRMWQACHPHRSVFITPMAAVAGAVAEELIAAYRRAGVTRAWVNNGGDIALHLAPGASLRVGVVADVARVDPTGPPRPDGRFEVDAAMPVRGVATSGWRGRSFSRGIADSVTVLAATAAMADAAATVIANAVDVADSRIERCPASRLKDDSDLGDVAVTVHVPMLGPAPVSQALAAGARHARELQRRGLVQAVLLVCQGLAIRVPSAGGVERRFDDVDAAEASGGAGRAGCVRSVDTERNPASTDRPIDRATDPVRAGSVLASTS